MTTLRPGESLDHPLTPEDRRQMAGALDAEARGEARQALELHLAALLVEESLTHHRIQEMVLLGEDAPAWMYSRWAVDQTARWMLAGEDPRCDQVVREVLAGLHQTELDTLCEDEVALKEYGTLVAACLTSWTLALNPDSSIGSTRSMSGSARQ